MTISCLHHFIHKIKKAHLIFLSGSLDEDTTLPKGLESWNREREEADNKEQESKSKKSEQSAQFSDLRH